MSELLCWISVVVYTIRVMFFVLGSYLERRMGLLKTEHLPFVSVIVPARNEELNIVACIESVSRSNYPKDRYELIVVNDRSTDSTAMILNLQQLRFDNLRVVTIQSEGEKNLQGKAGAIDKGIEIADGDILLLTDADCVVDRNWIQSHVREYSNVRTAMVCAYTLVDGKSFFAKIQSVEWNSTHTMASAGVFFKQYLGCFGNNMSIKKQTYQEIGGYKGISFSVTEDLALLQAVARANNEIRYLCSLESSVVTSALPTLNEYLNQHKRWAIGAQQLGLRAFIFVLTSAALWCGIVTSILTHNWQWLGIIFSVRIIGDFIINAPVMIRLNRRGLLLYNIPAVLFFSLLELVLPFLLIDKKVVWKNQTFHT